MLVGGLLSSTILQFYLIDGGYISPINQNHADCIDFRVKSATRGPSYCTWVGPYKARFSKSRSPGAKNQFNVSVI